MSEVFPNLSAEQLLRIWGVLTPLKEERILGILKIK
ncbi:hypothetical protein DMNBHIDG_02657 [Candidatus Methanoperedenaceae archaeon GB37]|nr:hypothetical protein DMNBHIDG_02657 [Candidatus Methanoperedenaceae archaeon GB37]